jgi:hypothetical protein
MNDRVLIALILSTLFIKELWTLFPADPTEINPFPFSDQPITKQTYIWFICYYAIQLIVVHTWYMKFPEWRLVFGVWFIFQAMEFVEYFLTYNESKIWFLIDRHQININVINAKYITIFTLTLRKFLWKM